MEGDGVEGAVVGWEEGCVNVDDGCCGGGGEVEGCGCVEGRGEGLEEGVDYGVGWIGGGCGESGEFVKGCWWGGGEG